MKSSPPVSSISSVAAMQISALPSEKRASARAFGKIGGDPPEELEESFFETGFDPVRHMLQQIPGEGANQEFFDKKVGQKMMQLDFITQKLSKQVMEHREEMVKGMQLVTELDKDLQVSTIISKNGRRHLLLAMHEVSQDLVVSANVRKKQVLLDMLPIVERIHQSMDLQSRLDVTMDEGNYARALQMCSECMLLLDDFSELSAIKEMNHSIGEWLQGTIEKVDAVLQSVCRKFHAESFVTVLDAYSVMDDVGSLGEKVQTFFAQIAVSETHRVIKEVINQDVDPQVALKKSRLPYNDLCLQLPESSFRHCLSKILAVLFDLMCSYYQMMTWQHVDKVGDGAFQTGSFSSEKNQLSNSLPTTEATKSRESSVVRSVILQPTSRLHGEDGSELIDRVGADGLILTGQDVNLREHKTEESGASMVEALSNETRIKNAAIIGVALEKGRKTVWELAARRVSALFFSDALCASSPHAFLQSLDWVNKFTLAGEAFSGAEAVSLRLKLVKQSVKYFEIFHRQNLEIMRIMLEKESWQQLPLTTSQVVNLAGFFFEGGSVLQSKQDPEVIEMTISPGGQGNSFQAGFSTWLSGGNPFVLREVLHSSADGTEKQNAREQEEADEDLLADFIDEDDQLPSRHSENTKSRQSENIFKDRQGQSTVELYTLTGSALSVLRYMDKYARLMQILQPITAEVLKGLFQLFEQYFFTIFKTFGQREAFSAARIQSDAAMLMTARLRMALVRISQSLEEQRAKTLGPNNNMSASPGASNNVLGYPEASVVNTAQGQVTVSTSSFYDLKERTVAIESLICMADIMKKLRVRLQMRLPQSALPILEQFFSQTVDAVRDLREHVFKALARLLLNVGCYVDRIAAVRWESKDLGLEHNGHIDSLLVDFKKFSRRVGSSGVSKEVQELLLAYGVDALAEVLVEGLSRVKKCNNEGRALMSLDLQVLINGLQQLAPPRLRSNLQMVETFIKAFYLPETEYLHWIRTHPEYTKSQVVGLVNLVASTNNWKKRSRLDLLEKIETGDNCRFEA